MVPSKKSFIKENPVMHLISKRAILNTSNEEMTMFSRKLDGSKERDAKIPVDIHI